MHRTLIVARMDPAAAAKVADIWKESDSSELPSMIGVTRRTLFRFHDLYFQLAEADEDITPALYKARKHPLYSELHDTLARFILPYDPNWREPRDSMATPFYSWAADAR